MSEVRVDCRCYVAWNGLEWVVWASSFLCNHRQGDHVDGPPPDDFRPTVGEDTHPPEASD